MVDASSGVDIIANEGNEDRLWTSTILNKYTTVGIDLGPAAACPHTYAINAQESSPVSSRERLATMARSISQKLAAVDPQTPA